MLDIIAENDSGQQIQEVSDESNSNERIGSDFPPKRSRFFSAGDPAVKTDPYFAHVYGSNNDSI